MTSLIAILMSFTIGTGCRAEKCDMLEVNHVYSEQADKLFTQVIAWDWIPTYSIYRCAGWAIVSDNRPRLNDRGMYVIHNRHGAALESKVYLQTWTQFDPERIDYQKFIHDERRLTAWFSSVEK